MDSISKHVETFRESKNAVSSVIGVILMVGLTVVLVATIAGSIFGFALAPDAPDANIVIRQARGNNGTLTGNEIVLAHKGGDTLRSDSVKIIIENYGVAYPKTMNLSTAGDLGLLEDRNIVVTYSDLTGYNYVNSNGKRKDRYFHNTSGDTYIEEAKIVLNDTWTPGRTVVLYGADGQSSNDKNNVDNKYRLNPSYTVTVSIVDIATNKLISSSFSTVKESAVVVGH